MKTLAIAIVATCIGHVLLQAAVIEKQFLIHFETDKFYLDEKAQVLLNNIAQQVCSGNYYEITAIGHTDNEGSQVYNETLSLKRVSEVKNYLITKGLEAALINSKWYGEKKPAAKNSDEQNKYLNRRVVLEVKQYEWKQAKEILSDLKSAEQEMVVSAKENCTIVSEAGIKINIPQNAFVTESGKPVTQGHVTVKITDALSVADWLKNNLTTNSPNGLLQSGGMFKIEAFQNNEALKLNNGKELNVEVPSSKIENGMSIFYDNADSTGNVFWQNSGESALPKQNDVFLPHLKMDTTLLNQAIEEIASIKMSDIPTIDPQFFNLIKKPVLNRKEPIKPKYPDKEKIRKEIKKKHVFDNDKKINAETDKEYKKQVFRYTEKMKYYEKNLKMYCKAYEAYEKQLNFYNQSLSYKHLLISNAIDALARIKYVVGINNFYNSKIQSLKRLKYDLVNERIKDTDIMYYEINAASISYQPLFSYYTKDTSLTKLVVKAIEKFEYLGYKEYAINIELFDRAKVFKENDLNYIKVNKSLSNVNYELQKARAELLKEKRELGLMEQSDLNNYYSASLNTMGWINIDKFYKQELTASINIDYENNSQVYLIYKNLNAMMSYYGGNMNVPSNERIIVFSVSLINGKPYYAKNELITKRNNQHHIKLQYKEGLLADIENEIKTI